MAMSRRYFLISLTNCREEFDEAFKKANDFNKMAMDYINSLSFDGGYAYSSFSGKIMALYNKTKVNSKCYSLVDTQTIKGETYYMYKPSKRTKGGRAVSEKLDEINKNAVLPNYPIDTILKKYNLFATAEVPVEGGHGQYKIMGPIGGWFKDIDAIVIGTPIEPDSEKFHFEASPDVKEISKSQYIALAEENKSIADVIHD